MIGEIADIRPSTYALSRELRLAASRSAPNEKGQALTRAEIPGGKGLLLNWIVNFVDRKGIQGQDLRLAPHPGPGKKKPGQWPVVKEPLDSIAFFIGDWTEKIQDLIIKKQVS
jgi:hypothetical protein